MKRIILALVAALGLSLFHFAMSPSSMEASQDRSVWVVVVETRCLEASSLENPVFTPFGDSLPIGFQVKKLRSKVSYHGYMLVGINPHPENGSMTSCYLPLDTVKPLEEVGKSTQDRDVVGETVTSFQVTQYAATEEELPRPTTLMQAIAEYPIQLLALCATFIGGLVLVCALRFVGISFGFLDKNCELPAMEEPEVRDKLYGW